MHFLYIIYSRSTDKFYIGETYNVMERVEKHNSHYYPSSYTKIAQDWEMVLSFECINENNAIYLEKFVKKMKSKKFIKKIIADPSILKDILYKR